MIIIAFGANLESRFGTVDLTLNRAVQALEQRGLVFVRGSSLWRSAPVPAADQPDFLNGVIVVDTALEPLDVLGVLLETEKAFGRVRDVRNEARVLDLDLLAYGDVVMEGDDLSLPHPRMHHRAFVLKPLYEVVPDWVHPVTGEKIDNLIESLPEGQKIEKTHAILRG